jgi:hypothetical protein
MQTSLHKSPAHRAASDSISQELAGRGYDLVVASAGDRLQAAAQVLRSGSVQVL